MRATSCCFCSGESVILSRSRLKASLDFNLERLNITLSPEQKQQLVARIVELGDQKKSVTQSDLPFLISEILQTRDLRVFEVKDYSVVSNRGLRPTATLLVRFRDRELHATGSGDGGYDAFMQALKSIEKQLGFALPKLLDYEVRIPPGGKTDALVETTIKWEGGMKTRGVHSDQLAAAIQATEHALNMIALRSTPSQKRQGTPFSKPKKAHGSTQHKKIAHARRG